MSEMEPVQPDLKTTRLLLRRLRLSDANFISTHAGDFQVARNLAVVPHPYPDGAAEEFIRASLAGETDTLVWLIEYGEHGQTIPAGIVSLKQSEPLTGILGYWVAPWLWGFGFATEAVSAVVERGRQFGFASLKAGVHEGNAASARVLVKAGFSLVGEGKEYSVALKEEVHLHYFELALAGAAT